LAAIVAPGDLRVHGGRVTVNKIQNGRNGIGG
jgi:hypothetical protein